MRFHLIFNCVNFYTIPGLPVQNSMNELYCYIKSLPNYSYFKIQKELEDIIVAIKKHKRNRFESCHVCTIQHSQLQKQCPFMKAEASFMLHILALTHRLHLHT